MTDPATKEAIAILRKAKRLMSRPGIRLAKEAFARDRHGDETCILSKTACGFCTIGALHKASARDLSTFNTPAQREARRACDVAAKMPADSWNDKPHRRKADVIRLYDRAIARLKAGEER